MLGKTTTFFNRNPMVLQRVHRSHRQKQRSRPLQRIVVVHVTEMIVNVVHVMMIQVRRVDVVMIETIGREMIIIEEIGIGNVIGDVMRIGRGMIIRRGMMIKRREIDIGMKGDGHVDLLVGKDRGVEVEVNHLEEGIIEVAGKEIRKVAVIVRRRNMRGLVVKWHIWRS